MILDFIKPTDSSMDKIKILFISLSVSIFFLFMVSSQGSFAISSEFLSTNDDFKSTTFSKSEITNSGFGNELINDGTFVPPSSFPPISLLKDFGTMTIQQQDMKMNNNNIYKIWSDNTPGNSEIFFAKGTDGGTTFTDPENISNNAGESIDPTFAVFGNNVYVVWSDNSFGNSEIFFAKSTDAGDNFTDPENISNNAGESVNPAIGVSENTVNVVWSDIISSGNNNPDCSLAQPSQSILWPANHKMKSINVLGVTDPDSDTVSINIDSITQDEPITGLGSGDLSPDGSGIGTTTAQIRAERSGMGDGRVYEITFTASDSNGGTCSDSVFVGVPKNQNLEPIDSGQNFESTVQNVVNNNIQNAELDITSGNSEILSVKSTDAGDNFTDPENISNNAGESVNPAIAVFGNNVYVVWNDDTLNNNEILISVSTDAGDNFTDPENISNNAGESVNPAIGVSENTVYVAWSNSASTSEIFFIKSTDAGDNFTDPENISNNEGTSENPVIAVSGDTVYVAWVDATSGNNQVPIAVSENGGENFSAPQIISNNADDISNLQITINGDNVSITWIDNSSGTNKILIAESTDGGDSFSAPKTVSNNPYVYVTWIEDNGNTGLPDAFIAVSNDNGAII